MTQITGLSSDFQLTVLEGLSDLNGDNFDEVLLASNDYSVPGEPITGKVIVLSGMQTWPEQIHLLDETTKTVSILGEGRMGLGKQAIGIQDVNGDGRGDFLVAAYRRPNTDARLGNVLYVFAGSDDFFDQPVRSVAEAQNVFHNWHSTDLGDSLDVGDLNGDGEADLVLGRPGTLAHAWHEGDAGKAAIFWSPFHHAEVDLASDDVARTDILGPEPGAHIGLPLEIIPDLSGDGIDELILPGSDDQRDQLGDVWFIRGRESWPAELNLAFPGAADFRIVGTHLPPELQEDPRAIGFASTVSAGDFDGNGQIDLAMSAGRIRTTRGDAYLHVFSGNTFYDITPPKLTLTAPVGDPTNVELVRFRVELSEPVEGLTASDFELVTSEGVINAGHPSVQADPAPGPGYVDLYIRRFNDSSFMTLRMDEAATITDETGLALDPTTVEPVTRNFAIVGPDIVGPDDVTQNSVPTMKWWKTRDTASYDVWIQPVDSNADPVIEREIPGDIGWHIREWQPSQPLGPGRHRFWIRSNFADGSSSPWSSKPFTVNPLPFIAEPDQADPFRPQIQWNAIPGVSGYRIFVTEITRQEIGFVDTIVSDTSFQPDIDWTNGRYRFWIAGVSENGFQTQWSDSVTVEITPELTVPATTLGARPTLQWSSVPESDRYEIYIGGNGNVHRRIVTGTSVQLDTDLADGHYRAWVRGSSEGTFGPWSELIEFSVGTTTRVATPQSPLTDPLVALTWPAVPDAVSYDFVVRNVATGEDVYRLFDLATNQTMELPLPDGQYQVWVRTIMATGARWGAETKLTVQAGTTGFGLDTTEIAQRSMNQSPEFHVWSGFQRPDSIEIYLTSDAELQKHVHSGSTLHWTPETPLPRGEYRWWYRARTDDGEDSGVFLGGSFNTNGRTVLDVVPSNETPRRPLFVWQPVTGIRDYEIRIDIADGSGRIYQTQFVTDGQTHFQPNEQMPQGDFRAWVRPRNEQGLFGSWSLLREFDI